MRYYIVLVTVHGYTAMESFTATPAQAAERHLDFWNRSPCVCWCLRDQTGKRHSIRDSKNVISLQGVAP